MEAIVHPTTDTRTICVLLSASLIIIRLVQKSYDVFYGPLSRFPGPKIWGFTKLGQISALVSGNEGKWYTELHREYGPVVRVGPRRLSLAGGASSWRVVYGARKGGMLKKDTEFYHGFYHDMAANVVTAVDDDRHAQHRKILAHGFSDKFLRAQEPLLKKWAGLLTDKLAERADGQERVDMVMWYNLTTFDFGGDFIFGEGLGMLTAGVYNAWVENIFGCLKIGAYLRAFCSISAVTRFYFHRVIFTTTTVRSWGLEHCDHSTARLRHRLQLKPDREDLWGKIISANKEGAMSLAEQESNAVILMMAGTETTATALAGTTYWLLKTPNALRKLTDEVRSTFLKIEDITLDALAKLSYLNAVLQEGLRMYPPAPIALPRLVPKEGLEVEGRFVPSGVTVGVHHMATYRLPRHFKNPDEFHPERWLGDPEYKDDHLDAWEPFSVGPRNCIGKTLAWHEMRMLLSVVLLRFDLKLCKESAGWEDQKIYTLWEKKPLWCSLTPRADT